MATVDDILRFATAASQKYDVPLDVVRGILNQESSMGQDRRIGRPGRAGELGDMQLTPPIISKYGVKDPLNDEQNIDAGTHYLSDLIHQYGGDVQKAVAHYNGSGPAAQEYANEVLGGRGRDGVGADGVDNGFVNQYMAYQRPLLEKQKAAGQEASAAEDKAMAALQGAGQQYKHIQEQVSANRPPEAPQQPNLPDAPKHVQDDPARVFGQFMPMLAAFGGLFLRNSAGASLNAAAAAMKAANEGDDRAFQQAHQEWQDATKKAMDNWTMQREAYDLALKGWETNNQSLLTQAEMIARSTGNETAIAAIAEKKPAILGQLIAGGEHAFQPISEMYNKSIQFDLEREKQRIQEAGHAPATRAYDLAYANAKSGGKTDEEATRFAAEAAGEVKMRLNAGADSIKLGHQIRQEYVNDKAVQAIQKSEQFFNIIDSIPEEEINSGQGQLRLLDAFTKAATGGQAIRQFMVSAAQKEVPYSNQARAFIDRLTKTNGQIEIFDDKTAKEFLKGAKAIVSEARQFQDKKIAYYADIAQDRGVDPLLSFSPDEMARVEREGLFKLEPSKIRMRSTRFDEESNGVDGAGQPIPPPPPPPKAPASRGAALPAKEADLRDGVIYQTAKGPAVWRKDKKHFEAVNAE